MIGLRHIMLHKEAGGFAMREFLDVDKMLFYGFDIGGAEDMPEEIVPEIAPEELSEAETVIENISPREAFEEFVGGIDIESNEGDAWADDDLLLGRAAPRPPVMPHPMPTVPPRPPQVQPHPMPTVPPRPPQVQPHPMPVVPPVQARPPLRPGHEHHSGSAPRFAPPSYTPRHVPGLRAIDAGSVSRCLYSFTYLWLNNRQQFWFFPTFVGRRSMAGYRWMHNNWVYMGFDLRMVDSFFCGGR